MSEQRTEFSKVTPLEDGRKRLIVSPKVPITYKTDYSDEREEWKDIDLFPRAEQGKLVVDQAPYILQAFDGTRVVYASRKKRETLEVSILGAASVVPVLRDGSIWWEDVFKDTDIRLVLKSSGVEYLAVVKTPDAPKRFVWEYKTDEGVDPLQYIGTVFAQDAESSLVKTEVSITSETKNKVTLCLLDVTFEEKKRVRPNEKIRIAAWEDGVVYPVIIDPTVNEGITTDSSDDGQEFIGFGWYADGSVDQNYIQNGAYDSTGAVRFQTVDVPNGATIDSATITIEIMYEAGSSDGSKIYGDDVDDAPGFSGSSLPSNITKTTASTTLNGIAVGSYQIDVTAIVQELVDRAGWAANNDMRFLLDYTSMPSGGVWSFADTGHATGDPATLEIVYTSGGGSPAAPTPAILQPISGGVVTSGGGMGL